VITGIQAIHPSDPVPLSMKDSLGQFPEMGFEEVFFGSSGSGSAISSATIGEKRNSHRSAPNTPADKRSLSSAGGSVKEMIKDMEKRDV
jgi:hypothetical protein